MTVAQYRSPTGAMIVGLVRVADVTSFIAGIEVDGTPVMEPENEVDWSSLRDKLRHGKLLFEDKNGLSWSFSELTRVDPHNALDD